MKLSDFLPALLPFLPGFSVGATPDHAADRWAHIVRENDGLTLAIDSADGDRWRISDDYQIWPDVSVHGLPERTSIYVARGKAPATIAREIGRRLLPLVEVRYAALRVREAEARKHADAGTAALAALVAAGCKDARLGRAYLPGSNGPVRVNGDSVTFERLTLPSALAARVVALIAEGGAA